MTACAPVVLAQLYGCAMAIRITASDLGTVSDAWCVAVRAAIKSSGRTIESLAGDLDRSRQYMARLLRGETTTIPVETYQSICDTLKIDPTKHLTPNKTIEIP